MRITVDRSLCAAMGICEAIAPDYFEVNDSGDMVLVRQDMCAEDADRVRAAVNKCPQRALTLV